jgi:hypothetical protein
MSVVRFNMASKVLVLNNFIGSVNSVRWVHYENIQRGSLAPVRYVAQAARSVCVIYLVG